jgi:class 3 adenylate cyclase
MEVLLTVLAGLGCVAMMGVAMLVLPRLGRRMWRNPRAQRLVAQLRRQTAIDRILSWVEAEQPDLGTAIAPDGTVTILFTDIEDSTSLNERLGDRRWLEVLRSHNSIVRECIREHGGYEVKSQGDGFMIAYPSARRGLECAIDMQRNLSRVDDGGVDEPLRVRIGVHTGEAIREGDDFYGRSVTLAARLGDRAAGGEILTSAIVQELVGGHGDIRFEDAGDVDLKGLSGSVRVYRVPWKGPESAKPKLRAVG